MATRLKMVGRFIRYWWENLIKAKEGQERMSGWIALALGVVIFICRWLKYRPSVSKDEAVIWLERSSFVYAAFVFILLRPFQRHDAQELEIRKLKDAWQIEISGSPASVIRDDKSVPIHLEVINQSAKTLTNVEIDVVQIDRARDLMVASSISLPLKIWPPVAHVGELHPGRPQLCRLFQGSAEQSGVMATLMSANGIGGAYVKFEHERAYHVRIRLTARDMLPLVVDYNFNFSSAMSLNPVLKLTKIA